MLNVFKNLFLQVLELMKEVSDDLDPDNSDLSPYHR